MAGEATTIARPYAEAVFARAQETGKLDHWSEVLSFLAQVVSEPTIGRILSDPLIERKALADLMLDIGAEVLDGEGVNFVKLLVAGGRLKVLPQIEQLYELLKADSLRTLKVHIRSAYVLTAAQERQIADALKSKLGRDVVITSEKDPELIGGIHIRAGDTVIDGSVRGQLQQLANELGI